MAEAGHMKIVPPPITGVYRCSRGRSTFALPDWIHLHDDGTFGNRFDDPTPALTNATPRFRTLYCATQRIATLGETLARFRITPDLTEAIAQITDDEETLEEAFEGSRDPEHIDHGLISRDWIRSRSIGHTYIEQDCRFADLSSHVTINHLNRVLAPFLQSIGVKEIDLSTATGQNRLLTQFIALYCYGQGLSGIRYLSRLDGEWECWAMFEGQFSFAIGQPPVFSRALTPDDPDLQAIAKAFSLSIEFVNNTYLRPWQAQ